MIQDQKQEKKPKLRTKKIKMKQTKQDHIISEGIPEVDENDNERTQV